ncbi:MAG: class I SAM-dependent methyltransferase [Opitutaceae bacterium]|nr:class I SAM-dependent methyltransferase [Opitutaceae bacterium]
MDTDLQTAEQAKYETMWRHDDYRRFSPGLYALEHLDLVGCFRKLGVRSILDAGCGSGKFMQRILEQHASEFTIRGFDIAKNCLDPWFAGREDELLTTGCLWEAGALPGPNDAVVCTDVMEHIPTEKVPAVLANLRTAATKAVFLGIALFPDSFGPRVPAPAHRPSSPGGVDRWRPPASKPFPRQSRNMPILHSPLAVSARPTCRARPDPDLTRAAPRHACSGRSSPIVDRRRARGLRPRQLHSSP